MANNTVREFALELKVSASTLLSQLQQAGVAVSNEGDEISDADKAKQWIANGAQPTDTVRALLKKNGVL